jgi:DNA-binding SARP family transcriptional activator/pimeloyl-ACP methyl ester carboxylesterase
MTSVRSAGGPDDDGAVRVRVLGAIEVLTEAGPVPLRGRQAALLAVLATDPGAVMSVDRLTDAVWGYDAPRNTRNSLQILVSRLRDRFGSDLVETKPYGYRLAVHADDVDSARFERLVERASTAGPDHSLALLARAERLWRGPAFAGHDDLPGVPEAAARLGELRLVARERRGRVLLDLFRYDEAVADLDALVAADPLRESAVAALMTALARLGRAAEALGRLADLRVLLRDSGLDPSPDLEDLQRRVLAGELAPAPATGRAPGPMLPLVCRRLVRADGAVVTYGEIRTGGPVLVFTPGWVSRLDALSSGVDPRGRILARLAEHLGVVAYDRFGTGLSAGRVRSFDLEDSVAELVDVLDAVGADEVALFASSAASPIAVATAARDDRISRLTLLGGYADGPAVFHNRAAREAMLDLVRSSWGMGSRVLANLVMPDRYDEETFARFQRQVATAEVAAGFLEQMYDADVVGLLSQVHQPTLVLHYADDPAVPLEGARQLVGGIRRARLDILEGAYHLPPAGEALNVADRILEFCTEPVG